MIRTLRELWLFFWRDLSIARTYRTVFVLRAVEKITAEETAAVLDIPEATVRTRFSSREGFAA